MSKLYPTVNFFSAVAGNITVKTKRESNLENYNQRVLLTLRFSDATVTRMSKKQ